MSICDEAQGLQVPLPKQLTNDHVPRYKHAVDQLPPWYKPCAGQSTDVACSTGTPRASRCLARSRAMREQLERV